ncbi:hypothetical protein BHF71_03165 [Vulcanibacillus modesticaldus]|uniref:Ribosomal processing cysteine protease Prp n=1 Tax=Vulcanibacillus modesticaldus TaxID=337097 RepID=A0A1D2YSS7_9BACI|nr:ribosomal-processing cysteine protease Prp [Vulcanibacillus modesticaldus]OEF98035.1 hypothetical protein BHF71_03165 [Vulcanibacillus modesticaldus]
MIKVIVKKSITEDRILHVTIKGHAYYDEPGKDIVCSAVSALAIGAVNSVEILLNLNLNPKEGLEENGYLAWDVPKIDDPQTDDRLQLLMKAMVESLLMIEEEYKRYIKVFIETAQ